MNESDQVAAFYNDLTALVHKYCDEFDLCYASMIGSLHIKAYELSQCAMDDADEADDEDQEYSQ